MFRSLPIIVLILTVVYVLADHSGLIESFDNIIHERDGWVQVDPGTYTKTELVHMTKCDYSILKDPEANNLQIFRGAVKKVALERMKYLQDGVIVEPQQNIEAELRKICKLEGGNTVIINIEKTWQQTHTQSLSMF